MGIAWPDGLLQCSTLWKDKNWKHCIQIQEDFLELYVQFGYFSPVTSTAMLQQTKLGHLSPNLA